MKVANHLDTVLPLLEKLRSLAAELLWLAAFFDEDKQQTLLGLKESQERPSCLIFTTFLVKKEDF